MFGGHCYLGFSFEDKKIYRYGAKFFSEPKLPSKFPYRSIWETSTLSNIMDVSFYIHQTRLHKIWVLWTEMKLLKVMSNSLWSKKQLGTFNRNTIHYHSSRGFKTVINQSLRSGKIDKKRYHRHNKHKEYIKSGAAIFSDLSIWPLAVLQPL